MRKLELLHGWNVAATRLFGMLFVMNAFGATARAQASRPHERGGDARLELQPQTREGCSQAHASRHEPGLDISDSWGGTAVLAFAAAGNNTVAPSMDWTAVSSKS